MFVRVTGSFFFVLILYVPVNNFSVMSGWVFLGCKAVDKVSVLLSQSLGTLKTSTAKPSFLLFLVLTGPGCSQF